MLQSWSQDKAYGESHPEHRFALSYIPKGVKVLDVGCRTAETGKEIAN